MKGFLDLRQPRDLLAKLEVDHRRVLNDPSGSYAAFDFCVTAWHLVDWKFPDQKDPKRRTFLKRNSLLRICEHLAVGAKHFEPDANRHNSVIEGGSPNPWGNSWALDSWKEGSWGGSIVIYLDGDAKKTHGDSIGLQDLADKVLEFWRNEV